MRSIENSDRLSVGLARGIVEGIRFRARSNGMFITDWVVFGIRDEDGDHHELRFNAELFAEIGGIAKLGELNGADIAGVAVHADFFGAPGGEPVRASQEMIWVLTGTYAGRLLRSRYQMGPNGCSHALGARDSFIATRSGGRAPTAESADKEAQLSPGPITE